MRPAIPIIVLASTVALTVVAIRYWPPQQEALAAPLAIEQEEVPEGGIPPSADDLPHPTVAALLSVESVPFVERHRHLRAIGDHLPQADRLRMLHAIVNEPPNGLVSATWHSLANDIMGILRHQKPFMPEYTDHLIGLWHDLELDPTLRDYALQHLREWVADGDSRTVHEERPEKLALIHRTFLEAATPGHPSFDPQSTTIGTILLALNEWTPGATAKQPSQPGQSAQIGDLDSADFESLLLQFSADASVHRGIRTTALQLCARREIREALPTARSILADPAADAILRIAAISCLGELGTADDLDRLTGFQQQNTRDPLLQASLHKAIQTLSKP